MGTPMSPAALVLGVLGLLLVAAVLVIDARSKSARASGGLGGWAHWRRDLGFKAAVGRFHSRLAPDTAPAGDDLADVPGVPKGYLKSVPDGDKCVFLGYPYGTTKALFIQHEDSVLVNGPSRSGKSRYIATRQVASAVGPVASTSTKIELLRRTAAVRAALGELVAYDPLGLIPATSTIRRLRWDPVVGCEDPEVALRRGAAWAGAQPMNGVKNGDWFNRRGAAVLAKLLHAAALDGRDVLAVKRWGNDLTDRTPRTILAEKGPAGWADDLEALAGNKAQETVGSIAISMAAILECLDSPRIVQTVTPPREQHFDMTQFLSGANSLYLLASEQAGPTVAPLFTMLIDELMFTAGTLSQTHPGGYLWKPLRIVGDEWVQLAPVPKTPEYMADSGGRGIQLEIFVQSEAQLRDRFGPEKADAIVSTASVKLYLPGNSEEKVAARLSRITGKKRTRTYSGSRQMGGGRDGSTSNSWSTQLEERLPADMLRELPQGHAWMEYRALKLGKVRLPEWSPPKAPTKKSRPAAAAATGDVDHTNTTAGAPR
ncbi:TraM recognition domain-containing protein [Luteipulveratus sp. YIM 133132]|uniref:type IV secretory system conjugative DNA transfer family protein n=1 Tax=Luteipulveratus flavus TaxID=3031728 RepID=UPI0023B1689B|nr:TraM recognition domain-containing protein [Luteipulveratus sp. YIM 133132]MDE9364017.1 TraM recognition domain-containing protein [Luteipulveratus sp. YIM 133132]